ncbi:MAG: hypothetical protein EA351_06430 [Gemmatimonadales bacterium]|nr:MAG: hypothetical protein EA351_06430 [Gemmatimonadales bacterium]
MSRPIRSPFRIRPVFAVAALLAAAATVGTAAVAHAQAPDRIQADPATVQVEVGQSAPLTFTALDADGNPIDVAIRVTGPRGAVRVEEGAIRGLEVGTHTVTATEVLEAGEDRDPLSVGVPVEVRWPAVVRVEIEALTSGTLFEGSTQRHRARAFHADGSERPAPDARWESRTPEVVEVDRFGNVSAVDTGHAEIEVTIEGVSTRWDHLVEPLPELRLSLEGGDDVVRTGDVQHFRLVARTPEGVSIDEEALAELPVRWSLRHDLPDDLAAPPAPGQIRDGRVVADIPGDFTVVATVGGLNAQRTFRAEPRDVVRNLEVLGQGRQDHVRTTDFWVFEGNDGRDYVITGAKMSDGQAFVFDVTDPANMVKTDSIRVDARSINDVKVSPDGRFATLTREGASDRVNGLVILDLTEPAHPRIASEVTEGLTGGVHNAYPLDDYVFALSGGRRYVILDVRDIENPILVSEVEHEDCGIHDVWYHDGVAYSAQWGCGVIAYDVGNGAWGGSKENPVFINSYIVPGEAATHAVFPYYQEATGRFYLFIGDEIMNRRGLAWQGVPGNYQIPYDPETGQGGTILSTRGYIQVIDFTDPAEPEMVARYEVPEYGTHNIWVEDDVLYQAYYEGGLRVVDVSGELMGNLYTQGREIAVYRSADPIGYVPNSPMVWSAMPYKGMIFFSDTNSGIWAVQLEGEGRPVMQ